MKKNTFKNIVAVLAGLIMIAALSFGADSQTEAQKSVTQNNQKSKTKDLVVTRAFDAPVDDVWKYWTDSEKVMKWWGPTGFTSPVAKMDFREGGSSLVCMRSPDGQDFYNTWNYRKIEPKRRIEFILSFVDKDGVKIDPVKLGLPPDLQQDVRHVVSFKAKGAKTEMTITEYGYTSDQMLEISKAGLNQCLDKMAGALAKP